MKEGFELLHVNVQAHFSDSLRMLYNFQMEKELE